MKIEMWESGFGTKVTFEGEIDNIHLMLKTLERKGFGLHEIKHKKSNPIAGSLANEHSEKATVAH